MGFFRYNTDPEKKQAKLNVSLSASPTLSLSNPKTDLVPGKTFEIATVTSFLGIRWWCWGDLDGDLQGKKLHVWHAHEGYHGQDKPQKDDGWVLCTSTGKMSLKVEKRRLP